MYAFNHSTDEAEIIADMAEQLSRLARCIGKDATAARLHDAAMQTLGDGPPDARTDDGPEPRRSLP